MSMGEKIKGILIGIDAAAAAVLFNGMNDITISARCGMALMDKERGVYDPNGPHGIEAWALNALAKGLDAIEKDHCISSILGDRDRAVSILGVLMPYTRILSP